MSAEFHSGCWWFRCDGYTNTGRCRRSIRIQPDRCDDYTGAVRKLMHEGWSIRPDLPSHHYCKAHRKRRNL